MLHKLKFQRGFVMFEFTSFSVAAESSQLHRDRETGTVSVLESSEPAWDGRRCRQRVLTIGKAQCIDVEHAFYHQLLLKSRYL